MTVIWRTILNFYEDSMLNDFSFSSVSLSVCWSWQFTPRRGIQVIVILIFISLEIKPSLYCCQPALLLSLQWPCSEQRRLVTLLLYLWYIVLRSNFLRFLRRISCWCCRWDFWKSPSPMEVYHQPHCSDHDHCQKNGFSTFSCFFHWIFYNFGWAPLLMIILQWNSYNIILGVGKW